MSSGASGHRLTQPTDWENFTHDKEDKPPSYSQKYSQEPIFEGSYIDDDEDLLIPPPGDLNQADDVDLIGVGFINPAFQNPPDLQQHQQQPLSQHDSPYQSGDGGFGPPTNYNGQHYSTLHCRPSAAQGYRGIGQPPTYPHPNVNDPRASATTCPPSVAGQSIVLTQPQTVVGQPSVILVQPILVDPPNDYLGFSIFVTLCCCWAFGIRAIIRSVQCRSAIAAGDRQLANEKSIAARKFARVALGCGIVMHIVAGVFLGVRFAYMRG